jgi:hypothetical protein
MDKSSFIELAPMYYAIAIRAYFEGVHSESVVSRASLRKEYLFDDGSGSPELQTFLENEVLLDRAIQWLLDEDMIDIIEDDFAPPLFLQTERANDKWEATEKAQNNPYFRYRLTPHTERRDWLTTALSRINLEYLRLGLEADDFDKADSDWEPLPLDRTEEQLAKTIKVIDETIEAVRADNGYGATQPEEKAYVLEGLNAFSKTLKEAETISVPYIKTYALEPLARLIKRFGLAAVGISAALAKDTIYSWLKVVGIKGLEHLWKAIFGS